MTPTEPIAEISFGDIRAMMSEDPPPAQAKESTSAEPAKPETPEAPPVEAKLTEPAPGTGSDQPKEEVEEELPEGVKKRIAKEVERTSRAQREIDQAVSTRKAKEAELAKLKGEPGSAPVKETAPNENTPPPMPDILTFKGTTQEYQDALQKALEDRQKWFDDRTRKTVTEELAANQQREEAKARWDAAVKEHGQDFPALMESVAGAIPEGLQVAISRLDSWSGVAVHLAKNPAEMKTLAAKFDANPYAAIAELGKLEERLTTPAKPKQVEKPLPAPLKPVAGGATGAGEAFDFEKADFRSTKAQLAKLYP